MSTIEYWKECISISAEECELTLTNAQLECLAAGAEGGHEHFGMAFYSPPPSDRLKDVENEWKTKYAALKREFDAYRGSAEAAVKQALGQHSDSNVSISAHGEVFRHGGRTERLL